MPVEVLDETGPGREAAATDAGASASAVAATSVAATGEPSGAATANGQPPSAAGAPTAQWTVAAARAAEVLLAELGHADSDLCIVLVDDERMQELNRDWRGKDRPTDVLSFAQLEGEQVPGQSGMLGDVVISMDTTARQAAEGGWTLGEELVRLVLHGVLHLLGHDHEQEDEARVMRAEEARLAALLADAGIACAWEEGA